MIFLVKELVFNQVMYFFLEFYLLLVNEILSWYYDLFYGTNFYLVQSYVAQTLHFLRSIRVRHIFGHMYDIQIL